MERWKDGKCPANAEFLTDAGITGHGYTINI